MKIGIIDADLIDGGTRHPNLALMKISGYYKEKGNEVKLLRSYDDLEGYDLLFLSRVFTFTNIPEDVLNQKNLKYGGTGFLLEGIDVNDLQTEIEHHMPDYELYKEYVQERLDSGDKKTRWKDYLEFSIGFITRGCFRKCDFCVNKKYDSVFKNADVAEFFDESRKRIYLWDDNFLAYHDWENELNKLEETGRYFQFRQGLDVRLLNERMAEKLSKMKYYGDYIFAFDFLKDAKLIDEKLKLWRKYSSKGTKLYLFCAYNSTDSNDIVDLFKRIEIIFKNKCLPYVMRYENYKSSDLKDMYIQITRWANQQNIVKKMSFREFCMREQELKKDQSKLASSYRAMVKFEKNYPDIAQEFFDLKYSNY